MSKTKTCFISAPAASSLAQLTESLAEHGYRPVAPTDIAPGLVWIDALRECIQSVDLVVGVFAENDANANVAFEVGFAAAQGVRVLVLAPPDTDLPFGLDSLLVVRGDLRNRNAIDFALAQLSAAPVQRDTIKSKVRAASPLGLDVSRYEARVETIETPQQLEALVAEILRDSRVDVISEARIGTRTADFAVWSDRLDTPTGSTNARSLRSHAPRFHHRTSTPKPLPHARPTRRWVELGWGRALRMGELLSQHASTREWAHGRARPVGGWAGCS